MPSPRPGPLLRNSPPLPARLARRRPLATPLPRRFARVSLALGLVLGVASGVASTARQGASHTALDRYVAQPDPHLAWKAVSETRDEGVTAHTLELVSQHWLSPAEVNQPAWRHTLTIVRPDTVAHATALLFLGGGSHRTTPPPGPPARPSRDLVDIARSTGSVVAELRHVPHQPLVFHRDSRERREDDLIAYTWDQYLRTGDERWPARLPMTKAAVRAMDTVTAFLASAAGGAKRVDSFVLAGGSKRGWTAWTTAAVDRRVVALCPLVIDILNVETSMEHHYRAYGFYAPAVGDYFKHGIMAWIGTPESKALYAIEDPYSYRDRLALPKLLINACGDQFFLPDSSQFYFSELPGVKYLRYVPNTDHSLKNSDASRTVAAWHHAILNRTPLPQFSWRHEAGGTIVVTTRTRPTQVLLWQATNPATRDFRIETFGPKWTSTPLDASDGVFRATVPEPAAGWTGYLVELTFEIGAASPLKLTTDVTVTPRTLPFAAPHPERPKGFLSK